MQINYAYRFSRFTSCIDRNRRLTNDGTSTTGDTLSEEVVVPVERGLRDAGDIGGLGQPAASASDSAPKGVCSGPVISGNNVEVVLSERGGCETWAVP